MAENPYAQYVPQPAASPPPAGGNPYAQYVPQADQQQPQAQPQGGYLRNLGAGIEEAAGNFMGSMAQYVPTFASAVAGIGMAGPPITATPEMQADLARRTDRAIGKKTGLNPEDVSSNSIGEMLTRNVGQALPYAPFAAEGGLIKTGENLLTTLGGVTGQTAAQAAGGGPVLQTIGALLGGYATGKATGIPQAVRRNIAQNDPKNAGLAHVNDMVESSGKTTDDLRQAETEAMGVPITGFEAIGRQGVTGVRSLGIRPGKTGDILGTALDQRAEAVGDRVMDAYTDAAKVDPRAAAGDIQSVVEGGQTTAKPLYTKAEEGGSIAPLEKQFEQENLVRGRAVNDAQQAVNDANNNMTMAQAKLQSVGDNVYGQQNAREMVAAAQKQIDAAEARLTTATDAKDAVAARLAQAQEDRENGVKGGMWSPYLQRLMQNQKIRQGMARGYEIERDKSDAENTEFDPTELAVTGTDAEGVPIVKGVPNMKVLDMGKRGLDAMIQDYADPITKKVNWRDPRVVQIANLKKSYTDELRRLNPDYGKALDASSDYLSAEAAFNNAQRMIANDKVTVKQFSDFINGLSDTNKVAAKGGVGNWLYNQATRGKLAGKNFNKDIMQQKLTAVMGDPATAATFLKKMNVEAQIAKSGARAHPGLNSATAESLEASKARDLASAGIYAAKAAYYGSKGHAGGALANLWAARERVWEWRNSPTTTPEVRDEAGKLLMLPPSQLADQLDAYRQSRQFGALSQHQFPLQGRRLGTMLPGLNQTQSQLSGDEQ